MKPFNLTEFKQGKPAVNRAGAIAHFVYHCPELEPLSRLGWRVGSDLYEGCEDGAFRDDCRTTHDLVGMKTGVRVGYVAPEDMEKHFRETVRRTLEEYPPAAPEDDVCGLCGKLGPDKRAHPVHCPGERIPRGPFVHAECEDAECARAMAALTADQRKAFLDTL